MTMLSALLIIISVLVTLESLRLWITRRKLLEKTKNIQWADGCGLPFLKKLLTMHVSSQEISGELTNMFAHCTDIRKYFLGPVFLIMVVTKAEYIETILNHQSALNKAFFYRFLEPLFGQGLFTAVEPLWRKHRKIVGSLFNTKFVNGHVDSMARHAKFLTEKLEVGRQDDHRFLDDVSNCLMDIVSETMFGCDTDFQETDSDLPMKYDQLFHTMYCGTLKMWHYVNLTYKLFSPATYKIQTENLKEIHSFISKVIHEKTKEYQERIQDDTTTNSFIMRILHHSLQKPDYTKKQAHSEVSTMVVASVDTTSTTSCFLLMCLGMEQEVQSRVYKEITDVLGVSNDAIINPELLTKLEYTERVIKETLRLFPIASYVARETTDDIAVGEEKDRKIIPAGSQLILSISSVHRNPDYWPEPLKFDPDRFLPDEVSKRPSSYFMPFSLGARNCVGWKWGMVALKTILATILREFRIKSDYKCVADVELYSHVFLRTTNGFKVTLEPR